MSCYNVYMYIAFVIIAVSIWKICSHIRFFVRHGTKKKGWWKRDVDVDEIGR